MSIVICPSLFICSDIEINHTKELVKIKGSDISLYEIKKSISSFVQFVPILKHVED